MSEGTGGSDEPMDAPAAPGAGAVQPTQRIRKKKARLKLRKTLAVGGGIVAAGALALAGTGIASALSAGSNYRTAPAEQAAVVETVNANGTIASATRYDLAFQTDGTVEAVLVSVGDTVSAGQALARLDESELHEAVTEAEQAVTDARQTLAEHQETQASGGSSSSASSAAATASTAAGSGSAALSAAGSGSSGSMADPAAEAAVQKVRDAQAALLAQYEQVQTEIVEANDLIAQSPACNAFLQVVLADGSGEGSDLGGEAGGADPDAQDGVAAGMTLDEAKAALEACQSEIATIQGMQASIGEQQQRVLDRAAELNAAVDELLAALEASGSGSGGGSGGGGDSGGGGSSTPGGSGSTSETPSGGTSGGGVSGGMGGTSTVITAEQLLADQAAIDLAEANLRVAQARLAFSAITSPIDGTVAAVSLAAGDSVTAGSDSAVITVLGDDGYVVETTISLTDIGKLAVGQTVEATVAASGTVYAGEVSSIGLLDVSSTSTPAFAVIVALDTGDDELLNGGSARLSIETASVDDALTVPSSAIHRSGNVTTVNVLRDGASESVEVAIGAVGSERTEILSGLEPGERVILADLTAAIDSGDSSGSAGLSGLGGSAGGTGFGGGSFPGGGDLPAPPSGGFPGG